MFILEDNILSDTVRDYVDKLSCWLDTLPFKLNTCTNNLLGLQQNIYFIHSKQLCFWLLLNKLWEKFLWYF